MKSQNLALLYTLNTLVTFIGKHYLGCQLMLIYM